VLRVFRSQRAEGDLIEIWSASYRRWGPEAADDYIDDLTAAIEKLGDFPNLGAACHWIRVGYRRLVVRHHCVFYRILAADVEIIRVLHERMDVSRLFDEEV
jgi:toxin ParE1/3/4